MAVKIRLRRMGSKKRPFYRIIATDSRNPRDGRFIETLGYYNPMTEPAVVNIKEDLVYKWMERGAVPSGNTERILRNAGVMKKWSLLKKGVSREDLDVKYEELKSAETPPMSAEERESKEAAQKAKIEADTEAAAKAEAEAAAKVEAEAAAKAETEAAAKAAEATGAPETPEAEAETPPAEAEAAPEVEAAPKVEAPEAAEDAGKEAGAEAEAEPPSDGEAKKDA